MTTITAKIDDQFYAGGKPYITKYTGEKDGLCYRRVGEEAFEIAAAFGGSSALQWTTVSLKSPWIIGPAFDITLDESFIFQQQIKRIVSVSIPAREIVFEI